MLYQYCIKTAWLLVNTLDMITKDICLLCTFSSYWTVLRSVYFRREWFSTVTCSIIWWWCYQLDVFEQCVENIVVYLHECRFNIIRRCYYNLNKSIFYNTAIHWINSNNDNRTTAVIDNVFALSNSLYKNWGILNLSILNLNYNRFA